ncbi:MAG: hypothetical protein K6G63_03660 [Eubacterium sp.]|nr:hypothetical protein [Eubacterium sp.]
MTTEENKYIYSCAIMAYIDEKEVELKLPTDLSPYDGKEIEFLVMLNSNFPINMVILDRIDVRELNELLTNINESTEYQQDVIFALLYNSRNRTFFDLKRAYHFRNDFSRVPRYGVKNAELNAAEFLFSSICSEDAEHFEDDTAFFCIFYMGLKSRDIMPFEEYYYVRIQNHNRIYSKEDIDFVTNMIEEGYGYDE